MTHFSLCKKSIQPRVKRTAFRLNQNNVTSSILLSLSHAALGLLTIRQPNLCSLSDEKARRDSICIENPIGLVHSNIVGT